MFTSIDSATIRVCAHAHADTVAWPNESAAAAEWRRWIEQVWATPSTVAAISVASPVLAERTAAAVASDAWPVSELHRLARALARYMLRMQRRATPFGLFAGAAPLTFGRHVDVQVGSEHRTRTRPDTGWMSAVIAELEATRTVRARLSVCRNDLGIVHPDRVVIGWQPHEHMDNAVADAAATRVSRRIDGASRRTWQSRTLCLTPVVQAILDACRAPITVADLIDAVHTAVPDKSAEYVDLTIARMIDVGALVTRLRPAGTVPDVLGHVLTELEFVGAGDLAEIASLTGQLRRIQQLMRDADTRPWHDLEVRRQLHTTMVEVSEVASQPTVVDLRHDSSITLPVTVAEEAAAAATALVRLGPRHSETWHAYRMAFVARYGFGAVVPLHELTDTSQGLGFPAHFTGPKSVDSFTGRDALLLRLAHQAVVDGQHELVVDKALLDQVEAADPGSRRAASNVDICIDVRAATLTDLAAGRFLLGVKGIGRSVMATTGRFLDLFDLADRQRMLAAYRRVPPCTAGGIVAQLSSPPSNHSLENVVHTMPTTDKIISVGEHRPNSPDVVRLDDLAVTCDADRLYLVLMSRRCTVQPVMGNAAAPHTMPPIARFLSEIARAADSPLTMFSWGSAVQQLPTLPRVRHGRCVLSAARWTISCASGPEVASWTQRFEVIRHRRGVPAHVQVGSGDQLLHLNLDEPLDLALLHQHAGKAPVFTLTEGPGPSDYGWIDGRAHEAVIPLITTTAPSPALRILSANAPLSVATTRAAVLPGADILFAKLYGSPALADTILIDHLAALSEQWDMSPLLWWTRFRDHSEHLRLRLQIRDYGHAATVVGRWAEALREQGLITSLALDTYQPETARYGHGALMHAAEELFAADSAAAVAQLRTLRTQRAWSAAALTAASLTDLASAVTGGRPTGMRWLIEHPEQTPAHRRREALDPALVQQAIILATKAGAAWPTMAGIQDVWQRRRKAATFYTRLLTEPETHLQPNGVLGSLLHMHHIRAHGIDPGQESIVYRLARAVALSWQATNTSTGGSQ